MFLFFLLLVGFNLAGVGEPATMSVLGMASMSIFLPLILDIGLRVIRALGMWVVATWQKRRS